MDLLTYCVISIIYILLMHFAIQINAEFKLFVMVLIFFFGGVVGTFLQSYEFGLVAAIIISQIKWEN
ncbi:hypothetical protein A2866_02710 [Candidatus Roizmanbacteria bacterium RIFCSPHIGHO2_01_FULL_39_8]|uniref:Uncharacterized protein n=3 Tax=Candidatus Roizmaniibacteriota TaxID=1752723 RepID=A0A1F7GQ27_9BACT|nr:MAG: hypothetical protein A2866_02710 [Candidatus Roizmanbacteria bacterium RIFCSPHIGHO2_01_FULL_39_8]OGK26937.1 MAG: hypothetical protein A3C28_06310 [Candidatus Roizmanbacteria bacterium RIFCSPHIGHO2_02_FULL_39_9]OGK37516.1 MAG: hypothetical protein A3F60_04680 [Candidatus Roizmanbacteria bacterium RIFCSPHIGHO2_12_FULL_39_8]